MDRIDDFLFLYSSNHIGSMGDRYWPLGILSNRHTWDVQNGCLLLNPSRVG